MGTDNKLQADVRRALIIFVGRQMEIQDDSMTNKSSFAIFCITLYHNIFQ